MPRLRHENQFTLTTNGMRVVLWPLNTPEVVAHCSFTGVGSSKERIDTLGFAHLLEHMVFKGTRTKNRPSQARMISAFGSEFVQTMGANPPLQVIREKILSSFPKHDAFVKLVQSGVGLNLHERDIDSIARNAGAKLNAFTSTDMTSYHFTTLGPQRIVPFLAIMSDCMEHLNVTDDHIASEVGAVLSEMKRGDDNAVGVALRHCAPLIFEMGTAGHHSTIGDEMQLMQATAQSLIDFHSEHYQPWNCTVSLTGNIGNLANMRKTIENIFGNVGVENYAAYQAVQNVRVGSAVNSVVKHAVDYLKNEPLKRALNRKINDLERAHMCKCSVSVLKLQKPMPLPSKTQRVVFDHSATPVHVYGFPIAGWKSRVPLRAWDAVVELLTGTASARLPSSFQSFVDRHENSGAFYLISSDSHDIEKIKEKLRRKVTANETKRVNNAMFAQWVAMQENPGDFAMHLVENISQNDLPNASDVKTEQIQSLIQSLSFDCMQHVIVKNPTENKSLQKILQTRKTQREENAALLKKIKKRVAPLEREFAVDFAPRVKALPWAEVKFPMSNNSSQGDLVFWHPTSKRYHFALADENDPDFSMSPYAASLAANTIHYGAGIHHLERAGVAFSIDGTSAYLAVACGLQQARQHIENLLSRVKSNLHVPSFETQRRELIQSLQRVSKDPVGACLHEAKNLILRKSEAYSLSDAINYVSRLRPSQCRNELQKSLMRAPHVFVRPLES